MSRTVLQGLSHNFSERRLVVYFNISAFRKITIECSFGNPNFLNSSQKPKRYLLVTSLMW